MQSLVPKDNISLFDSIRHVKDGREYWSARDLQVLMEYNYWREFEGVIEKAITACQNVRQAPSDHFGESPKTIPMPKGAKKPIRDYHLTRYGCYLVAMNGDPHKMAVAQAQAYFSLKTREAELAANQQPPRKRTLIETIRDNALRNLSYVPDGYFSISSSLLRNLVFLGDLIAHMLDSQAGLEESIERQWSRYAREVLGIPDEQRCKYLYWCQDRREEWAWAYPLTYLPAFEKWLMEVYFPKHVPIYQDRREQYLARHRSLLAARRRKLIP